MTIRVEREENPRIAFDRGFLDDARLSFRAKGFLAYVLSHPDAETFDVDRLVAAFGERRADILRALKELEAAGYYTRGDTGCAELLLVSGTLREVSRLPLLGGGREAGEAGAREGREGDGARSKADESAAAERILARLNELRRASWTWARYTPLSARHAKNVEHIKGRLHDGYGEAELVLVLEYLAAVDGGKEASKKYFDSVTPFNTKNFERNLAMARDWEARGRPEGDGALALQRSYGHDPAIYQKKVKGGST